VSLRFMLKLVDFCSKIRFARSSNLLGSYFFVPKEINVVNLSGKFPVYWVSTSWNSHNITVYFCMHEFIEGHECQVSSKNSLWHCQVKSSAGIKLKE